MSRISPKGLTSMRSKHVFLWSPHLFWYSVCLLTCINSLLFDSLKRLRIPLQSQKKVQNKLLRMMNNCTLKDHITTTSLLTKFNLPSVNQLSEEIKITEAWKIINISEYPIALIPNEPNRQTNGREVRSTTMRDWKEDANSKAGKSCFTYDTARLWNQCPSEIKTSATINQAKSAIKKYCKNLPTDQQ